MERRENQRVMITKKMLLEALVSLLAGKHISEISVSELCRAAGINRATFYKHYGAPNDILREVSDLHTRQMMLTHAQGERQKTAEQEIEESCAYLYENRQIIRLLIRNGLEEEWALQGLAGLVRQAMEANHDELECRDETDRQLLTTYIASGCYSMLKRWLMEDMDKTPKEFAALLYRICTRGWMRHEQVG